MAKPRSLGMTKGADTQPDGLEKQQGAVLLD